MISVPLEAIPVLSLGEFKKKGKKKGCQV